MALAYHDHIVDCTGDGPVPVEDSEALGAVLGLGLGVLMDKEERIRLHQERVERLKAEQRRRWEDLKSKFKPRQMLTDMIFLWPVSFTFYIILLVFFPEITSWWLRLLILSVLMVPVNIAYDKWVMKWWTRKLGLNKEK